MRKILQLSFIIFFSQSGNLFAQVQLDASGTANNFTVTYPAVIQAVPSGGISFSFKSNQNITGAATLNLNGTGAKPIYKNYDQPLLAGDIKVGHFVQVIYDVANNAWQMQSVSAIPTPAGAGAWTVNGANVFNTNVSFVGINNTAPGYTLDVGGNLNLKNDMFSGGFRTFIINPNATTGNAFVGKNAGNILLSGGGNALFGSGSGNVITIGSNNSFFGANSGSATTGGANNVFLGYQAAANNINGSNNVIIGAGANVSTSALNNAIAIGANAIANGSNMMALGGTGGAKIRVGIGTPLPQTELHVVGGARIESLSATGTVFANSNGDLFVSTSSGANAWTVNGSNIFSQVLANSVGIGTSVPGAGLDVVGFPSSTTGSIRILSNNTNSPSSIGIGRTSTESLWGVAGVAGELSTLAIAGDVVLTREASASSSIIVMTKGSSGNIILGNQFSGTQTPRVFIQGSSGNIGIGSTIPGQRLVVAGNTSIGGFITTTGQLMAGSANISNLVGPNLVAVDAAGNLVLNTNAGASAWTINGSNLFPQNLTQLVGIGTTVPGTKLAVSGAITVDNAATNDGTSGLFNTSALRFGGGSGEGISSKKTAGGNQNGLDFWTSTTNRMSITSAGNVGIGTTAPNAKLHVIGNTTTTGTVMALNVQAGGGSAATPTYSFLGDLTTGMFQQNSNIIGFSTNGLVRMIVDGFGNIGLGVLSLGNRLEVAGNAAIGAYAGVNAAPSNGMIISGFVGIGNNAPSSQLEVSGNIEIPAANDFIYSAPKTKYLIIPITAFKSIKSAYFFEMATYVGGQDGENAYASISTGSAGVTGVATAPVYLPDGAIVTLIETRFFDTDLTAGRNIQVELCRLSFSAINTDQMAILTTIDSDNNASNAMITRNTATITNPTVNNQSYSYYVKIKSFQNNVNMGMSSFRITYTVSKTD